MELNLRSIGRYRGTTAQMVFMYLQVVITKDVMFQMIVIKVKILFDTRDVLTNDY